MSGLINFYPYVSMDTEFPGVVHRREGPVPSNVDSKMERYKLLKCNVDELKIIQIGLTLTDIEGNLPVIEHNRCIWQINFSDFDVNCDAHAPDSINLLRRHGIDFDKNVIDGVDSAVFSEFLMSSGLILNPDITWITFHSGYDFGYILKSLTGLALPDELDEFIKLMKLYFGSAVYDVKYLMKFCNSLFGGLQRVSDMLEVKRAVGNCHQAGSDSLLTWHMFQKIRNVYFTEQGPEKYAGVLYGLEVETD
jgi:CCR4-NOT transcription complex subunit 7/8